jgi:rod shape-determining protein MreD
VAEIEQGFTEVEQRKLPWLLIICSSLLALLASQWPLPAWAAWIRPEFAVMLVVFLILDSPFRIGMVYAGVVGLALDILEGCVLGQQALALVVVAYLTFLFNTRIRMASLLEQALAVGMLVLVFLCIDYWVHGITGGGYFSVGFILPALSSAAIWPFAKLAMLRFR